MRSPASAIAWEFRQRHRLALIALAAYVLAFAAIRLVMVEPGQPIDLSDGHTLAAVVMLPLSTMFMYFLGVFTFGFDGDLTGRPSMYPRRFFTLPVTTRALAGWPMLYGGLAMATLLLTTASLVHLEIVGDLVLFTLRPWGGHVPLVWPAVLGIVFLAWTQVLTWMPYPLPGLRVIVTVAWLMALDAAVIVAIQYNVRESVLVGFLAPQIPLAYLAACYAVSRARCGYVPDWRGVFTWVGNAAGASGRRRGPFRSPAAAQLWFEWRQHGGSLPVWVGILLPFELGLLFLASDEPGVLVFLTLLAVLLTPPCMAGLLTTGLNAADPGRRDAYGITAFLATRPLTSVALTAAALKAALWSTLATWGLVLFAIPIGLKVSGTLPVVIDGMSQIIEIFEPPRALAVALLIVAGLMTWTWRRLVQRLCIGLTGRERLIKGTSFLSLSFLVVLIPILQWLHDDSAARGAIWNGFPWIVGFLACARACAAAWIAVRLHDARLLSDLSLLSGTTLWLAAVLALWGVLIWLFTSPYMARYVLLLIAVLGVPLSRLSAAPLALAWNRHR